jgi:hypothetical protein
MRALCVLYRLPPCIRGAALVTSLVVAAPFRQHAPLCRVCNHRHHQGHLCPVCGHVGLATRPVQCAIRAPGAAGGEGGAAAAAAAARAGRRRLPPSPAQMAAAEWSPAATPLADPNTSPGARTRAGAAAAAAAADHTPAVKLAPSRGASMNTRSALQRVGVKDRR